MNNPGVWLVIVLPWLAFIPVWLSVLAIIGRWSGWARLAKQYRTTAPFEGKRWHWQHATFRWGCQYSGALVVGVSADGLYLSIFPLFRTGHPPLFIPWTAVVANKVTTTFATYLELTFPDTPGVKIWFPNKLGQKIAAAFDRALHPDEARIWPSGPNH